MLGEDLNILYAVINLLIMVVGFFIRQHLIELKGDIKEIKVQTTKTNGRVGVVENDVAHHKSILERLIDKVDSTWHRGE
jgi:hypothetical protein